jgi:predicted nucleotidyltransferase component of viral defense system
MPSLSIDIPHWVSSAPSGQRPFRRAIHCILEAISTDERLRQLLCMKGGILLALGYDSPRFTTDIDFSTPHAFDEDTEHEVVSRLKDALTASPERLGYDIDCRLQGYKVEPGRTKTFVNIKMRIGYAEKGTRQHTLLMNGQAANIISIDYSFRESIPDVDVVEVGDDGSLRVYALSTLIAEKYRSLLQQPIRNRTRRQDVFDINFLLDERAELAADGCRAAVLSDFLIKCADRDIAPTRDSFDEPQIRAMAEKDYETLADELPAGALPAFDVIFERVAAYYRSLPWDSTAPL